MRNSEDIISVEKKTVESGHNEIIPPSFVFLMWIKLQNKIRNNFFIFSSFGGGSLWDDPWPEESHIHICYGSKICFKRVNVGKNVETHIFCVTSWDFLCPKRWFGHISRNQKCKSLACKNLWRENWTQRFQVFQRTRLVITVFCMKNVRMCWNWRVVMPWRW